MKAAVGPVAGEILLATCGAALGASQMTQENEQVRPWKYRQARELVRGCRRVLRVRGASEAAAITAILNLDADEIAHGR